MEKNSSRGGLASCFTHFEQMKTYQNFIGGEWVAAISGQTFQNHNPADTREVVSQYPQGGREDALAAIAAANAAFPGWAAQTSVARGRVLSKASQLIEARKPELAELLTREEGKTLAEAPAKCSARRTSSAFLAASATRSVARRFPTICRAIYFSRAAKHLGWWR